MEKYLSLVINYLSSHGLKIVLIIALTLIIKKVSAIFIERFIRQIVVPDNSASKEAEIKREDTLIKISTSTIKILIYLIAGLMLLSEIGIEIGPLIAAAGIAGVALGFGGQYLIRDLISGLFIILENQYRVGDVVKISGVSGTVEDVTLRSTTLRDLDGTVHHIPHGEITQVSNLSKKFARINLDIGISYSTNLEKVIKVVNKIGEELASEEVWKDKIIKAPKFLRVNDFADSAVIIKILGETKPSTQWEVTGELRKRLKLAFDKENIEIPFPQMVVHQTK